jgi:cytochrome P450
MSQSTTQPSPVAPPGPTGHFLVGNALDFSHGDWFGFFRRCVQEHGDVVSFRFLNVPMCLLTHPHDIESVLVKNAANFVKPRNYQALKLVLGNGLLTSEGESWQRKRKLAQPSFKHESITRCAEFMVDSARQMVDRWRDGESRDVHAEMMALTLTVVAKSLFGADVSQESANLCHALGEVSSQLRAMPNISFFLPKFVPTPSTMRLRRAVRELDRVIFSIIRERRTTISHSADLLQVLLDAHQEGGGQMAEQDLRDEVMTLFIAGHETTSLALSWAWYLLATHPEAETKLLEELNTVLDGREVEASDVHMLPYTELVVKETIRLYPPTWVIGREALNDFELHGYRLPAGTNVLLVPWITHRDARFYHEPERFDPDRWSDSTCRGRQPRFAYFPFGGGPRVCIGAGFAMTEAVLLLATIARRFRLTLASDLPIEMLPFVTLRPKRGIKMVVHERRRHV